MKKLFKGFSCLVLITTIVLLISCEDMYQAEPPAANCDTVVVNASMQYNIANNDREQFGGSPDVWAAAVQVQDSTGKVTLLFTEVELNFFKRRAQRNLSDTLK